MEWQRWNACERQSERHAPGGHLGPPERNLLSNLTSCPMGLAMASVADEAHRAYRWWENGQLGLLYPRRVPRILTHAIEYVHAVRGEWLAERQRALRVRTEQERK